MNKYLVESKIGWLETKRRTLLEAVDIYAALKEEMLYIKVSYPADDIMDIHATRKFNPCTYCFTELISSYGCPNIACPSKSMIVDIEK